jgi:hypothetical protein
MLGIGGRNLIYGISRPEVIKNLLIFENFQECSLSTAFLNLLWDFTVITDADCLSTVRQCLCDSYLHNIMQLFEALTQSVNRTIMSLSLHFTPAVLLSHDCFHQGWCQVMALITDPATSHPAIDLHDGISKSCIFHISHVNGKQAAHVVSTCSGQELA